MRQPGGRQLDILNGVNVDVVTRWRTIQLWIDKGLFEVPPEIVAEMRGEAPAKELRIVPKRVREPSTPSLFDRGPMPPCVHLGEPTQLVKCSGCQSRTGSRWDYPGFECLKLGGQATIFRTGHATIHGCNMCDYYSQRRDGGGIGDAAAVGADVDPSPVLVEVMHGSGAGTAVAGDGVGEPDRQAIGPFVYGEPE